MLKPLETQIVTEEITPKNDAKEETRVIPLMFKLQMKKLSRKTLAHFTVDFLGQTGNNY